MAAPTKYLDFLYNTLVSPYDSEVAAFKHWGTEENN